MHLTKLAGTPTLLLVTVVSLGKFGNGFPVRDFGSHKLGLHFKDIIQVPFHDIQVVFTLTGEDDLL